jgi:Icc-related predicted phosphoesterase
MNWRENIVSEMMRAYFAADVHGSELVWRKWLNVPNFYNVDIMILAGDLTGKAIKTIIKNEDGTYRVKLFGKEIKIYNEKELEQIKQQLRDAAFYVHVCTKEEFEEMKENQDKLDKLFTDSIVNNLNRWLDMAAEKVPKDVKVYVMPGNDDIFDIDDIIQKHDNVIYPLGKAIPFCFDYELISLEWVNPTPWKSPRECSEAELSKKLKELECQVACDWDKVICNFHCPPFNTKLDLAPKLDKKLRPVYFFGQAEAEHVGSKAIRKFIEEHQPLLGLHGHIHESYASDHIGNTLVLNPGSEYQQGILRGFIAELSKKGVERWWKVEG